MPLLGDVAETLVTEQKHLDAVVEESLAEDRIGLDTEFLREKTYSARLCLVQIATRTSIYLVDPIGDLALDGIGKVVADPAVQIVVHAGRQDFEIFYDLFKAVPSNVFDIQLAAGFAGYGASLPYGRLVEAVCSETLVKGESYSDWCRRPLTKAQLHYAADDVRYLGLIADRLKERLRTLGRLEWLDEEMKSMEEADTYHVDPAEAYRRVSGRGTLSGKQTAVLRELGAWREQQAARRNVPRGWVVKDQTLIEIARRAPSSEAALKDIRGMNVREAERSAGELMSAIQRGQDAPAIPSTSRSTGKDAQVKARILSGLADAVVRSRCEKANIATELVTTRAELEAVLAEVVTGTIPEGDEASYRLLTGWRREIAGDAVIALARGEIAVRATDQAPFIEEVVLGEE
ncbi:MAG TPA: ribonuclease D [Actinomycetota bacterium]|nr:ribonuclease D [Actinomycetota bacterium]